MFLMSSELVAQLVDPADAALSAGSNTKVAWRCPVDSRHVWRAAPNTRRNSPGCPVCLNILVLPGVNDLATTDPQLASALLDPALATQVHRGSHRKVSWACAAVPSHCWKTSVVARVRLNSGCPYCSGRIPFPGHNDLVTTHRELALTLVDPEQARQVAAGSAKKLLWRCTSEPTHTWLAPVRNRTGVGRAKLTGCPHCLGRNPRDPQRKPTLTEISSPLLAEAVDPLFAGSLSLGSGRLVSWWCDDCGGGHEFSMSVRQRVRGQGCPVKAGVQILPGVNDLATTHPVLAAQLLDPALATTLSRGSEAAPQWRCEVGHQWSATIFSRVQGTNCPVCSNKQILAGFNDLQTLRPDLAAQLVNRSLAATLSVGSSTIVEWRCPRSMEHVWEARVASRAAGSACPYCTNKKVLVGFNDLATTHPHLAQQLAQSNTATTITVSSAQRVTWICEAGHSWTTFAYQRAHIPTGCPRCATSAPEKELAEIIRSLIPAEPVLLSDRTLLDGQEVDITVPSRRLAIEFNGLYWHCETSGKTSDYHANKSERAATAGYQLIHVWGDDWLIRRDVVVRALAHKLGVVYRLLEVLPEADPRIAERIFARKLIPTEASGAEASQFLDANHIQGRVAASRHFALQDDDGAVRALLSLRSPRNSARMNRDAGEWEIQRYATMGLIPGGFTRLIKHAETVLSAENETLDRWISFSSADISDGGMYRSAGFTAEATLPADYKYVGGLTGWRRAPKEKFQKKRFRNDPALIWHDGWTEREAAAANDLHRIYDSGKTRWVKSVVMPSPTASR